MILKDFEFGYTPENLRRLLEESGLSQKEAREIIGKGRNTFSRYLYEVSNHNHVSMAHVDWLTLLEYVKGLQNSNSGWYSIFSLIDSLTKNQRLESNLGWNFITLLHFLYVKVVHFSYSLFNESK